MILRKKGKNRLRYQVLRVIRMCCSIHTSSDPDRVPDTGSGRLQGVMKAAV